jgi:XTP/dITP diphosphohydrolase
MILVFATHNRDKVREITAILSGLPVQILTADDFPDFPETIEDGTSCKENALKKAREMCEFSGHSAIADDTGLYVDALGGAPGIFAARYAGEDVTYEDNYRKLLREMADVPYGKRNAYFATIAALVLPDGGDYFAEGRLNGIITREPRGEGGFGYDPVFELSDGRTLAQIDSAEKNRISHRGKAFRELRRIIESLLI